MEKNKLQTEICVGIDFNTSNYCVGVYIKGSVKIVPNKIGDTITPSIILFKRDLKDGEPKEKIFVGEEVLYEPIDDIKHLIYGIKSLIGLDYKQFCDSGFNKSLNYLVKNVDGQPKIEIDYNVKNEENVEKKYYTAIEIISYIFKKIVRNTEDFIIETLEQKDIIIKNIVFTVPTQYTDKQKKGILEAAKLAGIENPKVIIEPISIALAYEIGKDLTNVENEIFTSTNLEKYTFKLKEKILIFNLGEGTSDITILTVTKDNDDKNNYEVDLTDNDIYLGGNEFNKLLIDYCINEFCKENELDKHILNNDIRTCRILKVKCANAIKLLNIRNEVTIKIENFYNEIDLILNVKRHELDSIYKPLYERINKKLNNVLEKGKYKPDDIDKILLVGGETRISAIKNLFIKIFGENKIKDDIIQDEIIAIGATLESAKSQIEQYMKFDLHDIIPYDIGIEVKNPNLNDRNNGNILYPMIKRFRKIPIEKEKKFQIELTDDNPNVHVIVYEGNQHYIKNCQRLGGEIFTDLKKKGVFVYKVKLVVDINGRLSGEIISEELNLNKKIDFTKKNTIAYAFGKNVIIDKTRLNLNYIANIKEKIKENKKIIDYSQDQNEKYKSLIECSKLYEELINKCNRFIKYNNVIYEKLFTYTKELFNIYLKILEMKKDIQPIIQKIKNIMQNLIVDQKYIDEMIAIFKDLRLFSKDEYYTIFCNFMEVLIKEGIKKLSGENYIRYYPKLYFDKVFYIINKYVVDNDLTLINSNIKKIYDSLKVKNEENFKKLNSFVYYMEIFGKEGKFSNNIDGIEIINNKNEIFEENNKLNLSNELSIQKKEAILRLESTNINKKLIKVYFNGYYQKIQNYQITCYDTDIFCDIEEKLYLEKPELKNINIYFLSGGRIVKKYLTLKENHIEDNSGILIEEKIEISQNK